MLPSLIEHSALVYPSSEAAVAFASAATQDMTSVAEMHPARSYMITLQPFVLALTDTHLPKVSHERNGDDSKKGCSTVNSVESRVLYIVQQSHLVMNRSHNRQS